MNFENFCPFFETFDLLFGLLEEPFSYGSEAVGVVE